MHQNSWMSARPLLCSSPQRENLQAYEEREWCKYCVITIVYVTSWLDDYSDDGFVFELPQCRSKSASVATMHDLVRRSDGWAVRVSAGFDTRPESHMQWWLKQSKNIIKRNKPNQMLWPSQSKTAFFARILIPGNFQICARPRRKERRNVDRFAMCECEEGLTCKKQRDGSRLYTCQRNTWRNKANEMSGKESAMNIASMT